MARKKNVTYDPGFMSEFEQRHASYLFKHRSYIDKIILNRINWKNLPDTIDERFLERALTHYGRAVFYNSAPEGSEPIFLAARVVATGPLDVYDNQHELRAIGSNYEYDIPEGDGVMIWNSTTRRDDWAMLDQFAIDLAELDGIRRLNRSQQKWGLGLTAPQGSIDDAGKILRDIEAGVPVMIALEGMGEKIKVDKIDLSVPYLAKEFAMDQESILKELHTYLGVVQPKEQPSYVSETEVELNNDIIARIREDLIFPRQQAIDVINKTFNLDISIEWRNETYADTFKESVLNDSKGGEEK